MKTIKLYDEETDNELSVNVKNSYDELTISLYYQLQNVLSKKEEYEADNKQMDFLIDQICLLTDVDAKELQNFSPSEFQKITEVTNSFGENAPDISKVPNYLLLDNVVYVPRKKLDSLSAAEHNVISSIQRSGSSQVDIVLGVLAVLIRPGYQKNIGGVEKYIQHIFDIDTLEERKILFESKLPVSIALPMLKSFLIGTKV